MTALNFPDLLDKHFIYRNKRTGDVLVTTTPQLHYELERCNVTYIGRNYIHGFPLEYLTRYGRYVVYPTYERAGFARGPFTVGFHDSNGVREIHDCNDLRAANRVAYALDTHFATYEPYKLNVITRWLILGKLACAKNYKSEEYRKFLELHDLPSPYATIGLGRNAKLNGRG